MLSSDVKILSVTGWNEGLALAATRDVKFYTKIPFKTKSIIVHETIKLTLIRMISTGYSRPMERDASLLLLSTGNLSFVSFSFSSCFMK